MCFMCTMAWLPVSADLLFREDIEYELRVRGVALTDYNLSRLLTLNEARPVSADAVKKVLKGSNVRSGNVAGNHRSAGRSDDGIVSHS